MKFGAEVKAVGTVAHSFIEFFPTEFDAFKAFADTYPDSVSLLLDTYNIMLAIFFSSRPLEATSLM